MRSLKAQKRASKFNGAKQYNFLPQELWDAVHFNVIKSVLTFYEISSLQLLDSALHCVLKKIEPK